MSMFSNFSKIFPRSGLLVLSTNSIQSLVPSTLVSQAESLLDAHRIQDVVDLADRQRKKLESRVEMDEDEADELSYIYLLIGFQCFKETLFEDAGQHFFNGNLDPRILISYYPELRGTLYSPSDTIDLFAGIQQRMPPEASVEDIVHANIVSNYSPHMKPDTRSAPPTAELRKVLNEAARDMLRSFLRRWKARDEAGGGRNPYDEADLKRTREAVNTVYLKLLASAEETGELYGLISSEDASSFYVVLDEVEGCLIKNGQYNALSMLYRQRGADERCLDLWGKLAEGEYTDPDIPVPSALSSIVSLLSESNEKQRSAKLINQWGIWMLRRGFAEQGMRLLMMPPPQTHRRGRTKSKPKSSAQEESEDLELLREVDEADFEVGKIFLEWLVFGRRKDSRELHERLARTLLDDMLKSLEDKTVFKLWKAKSSSFTSASQTRPQTFLTYLSQSTPDSAHKRLRIKAALFLQGSDLYDFNQAKARLDDNAEHASVLVLERAIVEGKQQRHRTTLSLLIHTLHDPLSAEAYCTLSGSAVIPAKTALAVAAESRLYEAREGRVNPWTESAMEALFPAAAVATNGKGKNGVDEQTKKELVRVLLEVYMSDTAAAGEGGDDAERKRDQDRAKRLLDSQAVNLDVVDILTLLPSSWPLESASTFLARSFRRTVHAKYEGKIVRAVAAGQNLEVKDKSWLVLREEGMLVEEALSDDDDEPDETGALDEKSDLIMGEVAQVTVADEKNGIGVREGLVGNTGVGDVR